MECFHFLDLRLIELLLPKHRVAHLLVIFLEVDFFGIRGNLAFLKDEQSACLDKSLLELFLLHLHYVPKGSLRGLLVLEVLPVVVPKLLPLVYDGDQAVHAQPDLPEVVVHGEHLVHLDGQQSVAQQLVLLFQQHVPQLVQIKIA